MTTERLRDLAFVVVVAAVLLLVAVHLRQKADRCAALGGRLEVFGVRTPDITCHLPDGTIVQM